jgi:hypothetical protein
MIDWYVLLTPLLVLPIFLLFRFVGCDALFGLTHVDDVDSYEDILTHEQRLVAWWRLGEQNNDPQAKDEKASHPGAYGQPLPTAAQGTSQPASGQALQGQPRVGGSDRTSVDFQGGYVAIPFDAVLNTASFTVEFYVFPGAWEPVFDHAAVTSAEIDGADQRGFSVFARWRPVEQKSYWSANLGTGTTFVELTGSEVKMQATYVAFSHDQGTGRTTLYVATVGDSWDALVPTMLSGYTPAQSNHLYIGANSLAVPPPPLPPPPPQTAPPVNYPVIGRIQEVALYNVELSETALAKHRRF